MKDRYDNPLSTTSQPARDAYIAAVDALLSAAPHFEQGFERAIGEDPDFALAYAGLARAHQSFGRMAEARAAIAAAEARLEGTTPREQSHVAMLSLAIGGKAEEARQAAMAHIQDWPRDAIIAGTVLGVFSLLGFSGRPGREIENVMIAEGLAPHYGDDWWFLGQRAFALMEAGLLDAALQPIDRSLALFPRNANSAHYRSHLYYEMGDSEAGRAFLSDWMQGYDRAGAMHCHNQWHIALWSLGAGDTDQMWAVVERDLRPGVSVSPKLNILTDLASLYGRANWAGVEVPDSHWAEVSAMASEVFPTPGQQFADIHAALAHAMAGQGEALAKIVKDAKGPAGDIVRPTAEAFGAVASGNWAEALGHLTAVMPQHQRFGGSRAQRDLIEFAYMVALMKLGKGDEAARLLALHRPQVDYRPALPDLPALATG